MIGLNKHYGNLPEDPAARPFAGLERNADGRYDDGELSKIFTTACESVSGAFGARNIPKVLRSITILGIEQSRSWNLASLNEYRAHFGLKTYDTFEEINSDHYVAQQLRGLYEHPDYVELYPGLAIESYKGEFLKQWEYSNNCRSHGSWSWHLSYLHNIENCSS